MMPVICIGIMGAVAAFAVLIAVVTRVRTRRLLERLDNKLNEAIDGRFRETHFDESAESSIEAKMGRFLSASLLSERQIEKERDQIKTLISDISHQTKTPVANLTLYADLLQEQPLTEEGRTVAEALSGQVEKLRFLIDALVKLSRLETGILQVRPHPQPVQSLIWASASQIAPKAAQKGVSFTAEETDAVAAFDLKWTGEALYNLIDNAVKYTPPGGRVTLSVIAYEMFCRIDVTDTGRGIPEDEQAKVFGRFYRGREAEGEEGVGIGLFLAREIVTAQGGYLKLRSEVGGGTQFSMFLPRTGA